MKGTQLSATAICILMLLGCFLTLIRIQPVRANPDAFPNSWQFREHDDDLPNGANLCRTTMEQNQAPAGIWTGAFWFQTCDHLYSQQPYREGSVHFFMVFNGSTYNASWLDGKSLQYYRSYDVTGPNPGDPWVACRTEIYDGAYNRSSMSDFPNGSAMASKGNGLLQQLEDHQGSQETAVKLFKININPSLDNCTLFFSARDNSSYLNPTARIFILNCTIYDTDNSTVLLTADFRDYLPHYETAYTYEETNDYGYLVYSPVTATVSTTTSTYTTIGSAPEYSTLTSTVLTTTSSTTYTTWGAIKGYTTTTTTHTYATTTSTDGTVGTHTVGAASLTTTTATAAGSTKTVIVIKSYTVSATFTVSVDKIFSASVTAILISTVTTNSEEVRRNQPAINPTASETVTVIGEGEPTPTPIQPPGFKWNEVTIAGIPVPMILFGLILLLVVAGLLTTARGSREMKKKLGKWKGVID